jgi:hypothetical protein
MSQHPAHVPDPSHDDPANRQTIGEAAADEDAGTPAPSGLPPDRRRRGETADEDPGSQEAG